MSSGPSVGSGSAWEKGKDPSRVPTTLAYALIRPRVVDSYCRRAGEPGGGPTVEALEGMQANR